MVTSGAVVATASVVASGSVAASVVASASVVSGDAEDSTEGDASVLTSVTSPSTGVQATTAGTSIASRSADAISLIIAFFFIAISFQTSS